MKAVCGSVKPIPLPHSVHLCLGLGLASFCNAQPVISLYIHNKPYTDTELLPYTVIEGEDLLARVAMPRDIAETRHCRLCRLSYKS